MKRGEYGCYHMPLWLEYFKKRGWMNVWECDIFAAKVCLSFLDDRSSNDDHFASYASYYWADHVQRYDIWLGSREQEAEQEVDPDLAAALKRFLGSPGKNSANFQNWAQKHGRSLKNTVLSVMCNFGFYYTLRDWWTQPGQITAKMALTRFGYYDAFQLAAQCGHVRICRQLARLIEAVHPKGDKYYTYALRALVELGNLDMVRFLVREMKADVNTWGRRSMLRHSVAHMAAMYEPMVLQWLVDEGVVDLNRENDSGGSDGNVLIAAASFTNIETAQILLKAGTNVNAAVQNGEYGSALVAAAARKSTGRHGARVVEMVQLLLDHGADPNLPLRGGKWGSALEASMEREWNGEYEEERRNMRLLLLEAGADATLLSKRSEYGSALAAAAFWGDQEILKAIVDKVGIERAIDVLCRSRHPNERRFKDQQDIIS
jgi:hypothetical protein